MPLSRFLRAPLILSPSFLALATWVLVGFLYSLHLSSLLLFSTQEVIEVIFFIVAPILAIALVYKVLYSVNAVPMSRTVIVNSPPIALIEARVSQCLRIWIVCAVLETIISGGVPLGWLLVGSAKTNFDYGVSSVHGMVNALLLALAVTSFALFLYTGKRRHLWLPVFALVWSIVLVSRGTLFVLVAECVVVFLRLRSVRGSSFIKLFAIGAVLLLFFGYVGDIRSGAEAFKNLAQPTPDFPDWAPSGLLWAYIYITTPINNLLYTMHTIRPTYNLLLPNTAATLFPTVIRNIIYGKQGADAAITGSLVTEALNVSTAYIGPFQDLGRWGLVGFSLISTSLCEFFWRRNGFRNILYFSVFTQALMLSLFYNLLFSLPILGQLLWFYYFTNSKKKNVLLEHQHG
jgi:oligosaccharide repeat unit polymerase